MSIVVNPLAPRRGRASFSTLTAGMILRGSVPAQVLYAGAPTCPVPRRPVKAAAHERPLAEVPLVARLERSRPATAAPAVEPAPANAPTPKRRRAMTVRLDPVHHLRLRVVSSFLKRSSQQIFVAALEAYLDRLPSSIPGNCACMKARTGASTK